MAGKKVEAKGALGFPVPVQEGDDASFAQVSGADDALRWSPCVGGSERRGPIGGKRLQAWSVLRRPGHAGLCTERQPVAGGSMHGGQLVPAGHARTQPVGAGSHVGQLLRVAMRGGGVATGTRC